MIHWLKRKISNIATLNITQKSMIEDLQVGDVVDVMDGDKHIASYGLVEAKQMVIPSSKRRIWNIDVGEFSNRQLRKIFKLTQKKKIFKLTQYINKHDKSSINKNI